MGESTFYDRYYDKVNYMDVNASYTFGKKFKTTFYAEANNLLNQPLRYYQGTKRPYHAGRILRRESECGSED